MLGPAEALFQTIGVVSQGRIPITQTRGICACSSEVGSLRTGILFQNETASIMSFAGRLRGCLVIGGFGDY